MSYTKGEWKVRSYSVDGEDEHPIASVYPDTRLTSDESLHLMKANAHLIAAAPNQNQALAEIDQWLIAHPDISDDPQLHIIHIYIQDALAKAEGK